MRLVAVFLASAFVLSAFGGVGEAQDTDIILRVAMQDDMKTTNPLTAGDVWTWNVLRYLYDGPVSVNPDTDEPIPYIAVGTASDPGDSVEWADCEIGIFDYTDNSTWSSTIGEAVVFYDFEDVYWHDGEQMDVRDVMFSYHVTAQVPEWSSSMNCLKDNAGKNPSNFSTESFLHIYPVWESGDGLQAALKFVLTEPYADFFRHTVSARLLPYHVWGYKIGNQEVDEAKIWCDPGYNLSSTDSWDVGKAQGFENPNPVGSGPFEFEEWQKGQYIKISTYRDHFFRKGFKYEDCCLDDDGKTLARLPYIDGINYYIYKTAEAAVRALKNDDIDYIAWSVPPTFVQELANEPGVALSQSPKPFFNYMAFNMRRPSFGYNETGHDIGKPLRQAIAHCIDKNRIVQRLLLNFGEAGVGPFSKSSQWFNNSLTGYDFDPEKAISILENANYVLDDPSKPPGPGNYWNNPDGSPIGSGPGGLIEILNPEANYDPICAQHELMVATQMEEIGISAQSIAMDMGSVYEHARNYDFDMLILDTWAYREPIEFLYERFHSSQIYNNDYIIGSQSSGMNYAGYQNESFDEIIEQGRRTTYSDEKLQAILDGQASIALDLPIDVIYFETNIEAYRSSRFTGWVSEYGTIFNRWSIYNIRLPSPYKLNAQFVSPPSAVMSNSTQQITVFVKDQNGNPLNGAEVRLNASAGSLDSEEKVTNTAGKATFTWTAPYADPDNQDVVNNGTKAIIQIETATYDEGDHFYDPAPSRITLITVYPEEVPFLSVSLSADPDIIDPDYDNLTGNNGFTLIDVTVTDEAGNPVQGATVAVSVSPAIPELSPANSVTDADGKATFTLTATDLPDDDNSTLAYQITAYAQVPDNPDIKPGDNSINVFIVDRADAPPPVAQTPYPGTPILVVLFLATAVIYAFYRKKTNP